MIQGGVKPGSKRSKYEVFRRKDGEWELLQGDLNQFESAKSYKDFLTREKGYAFEDVVIQRVDWIAVSIVEVG